MYTVDVCYAAKGAVRQRYWTARMAPDFERFNVTRWSCTVETPIKSSLSKSLSRNSPENTSPAPGNVLQSTSRELELNEGNFILQRALSLTSRRANLPQAD